MRKVHFTDLGRMDYKRAWDLQERIFARTVARKTENRNLPPEAQISTENYLLFVEHPHVFTLGKSGNPEHLLADDSELREIGAAFYPINRGGDITYHGPGQIVGYPIWDLDHFFSDIHKYLRFLEESVIRLLADYGIEAGRLEGLTGVWLDPDNPVRARKICALGVKCSRWVTMHGFAFNVSPDLGYFGKIVPCGIDDKQVTSMELELGRKPDFEEVKSNLKRHLAEVFELEYTSESPLVFFEENH